LFNLIHIVKGRILRILALADLKDIESSVFCKQINNKINDENEFVVVHPIFIKSLLKIYILELLTHEESSSVARIVVVDNSRIGIRC